MERVKYLQVQLHPVSVQFCRLSYFFMLVTSSYLQYLVQNVEISIIILISFVHFKFEM